jgi:hypothetical protein
MDQLTIDDSSAANGVTSQGLPETEARLDRAIVRRESQLIPVD